jgi:hypothetical protein
MMAEPAYLRGLVAEAAAYKDKEGVTPGEAAHTIAYRHDEMTTPLRGNGRRDNLEVLKDVRDAHGICADELDCYRRDSGNHGEATLKALVRRSIEDYIHDRLSVDDYKYADAGVKFAGGVERDGKIGDVWQYDGEEVFIPITDTDACRE